MLDKRLKLSLVIKINNVSECLIEILRYKVQEK